MNYGKSIEIFLANGNAESLITAEVSNWNGKAIKIPRLELPECTREDVRRAGVYFLFCQEDDGTDSVYIGEAENIYDRLQQHLRDYQSGKEQYYWNTVVMFVGQDLNKALIRYLENRLVEIARECGKYKILTKNTYRNTVLKESQIAAMEEFTDNIRLLMNTLGYRVLVSTPQAETNTQYLYCTRNGANGKGFISTGGFTVVKGSKTSDHIVPSFEIRAKSYYNLRKKLEENGTIVNGVFVSDYEFSAPSAAAAVLYGRNTNGKTEWKTEDGVELKNLL